MHEITLPRKRTLARDFFRQEPETHKELTANHQFAVVSALCLSGAFWLMVAAIEFGIGIAAYEVFIAQVGGSAAERLQLAREGFFWFFFVGLCPSGASCWFQKKPDASRFGRHLLRYIPPMPILMAVVRVVDIFVVLFWNRTIKGEEQMHKREERMRTMDRILARNNPN